MCIDGLPTSFVLKDVIKHIKETVIFCFILKLFQVQDIYFESERVKMDKSDG